MVSVAGWSPFYIVCRKLQTLGKLIPASGADGRKSLAQQRLIISI
jgi:hypothetical protein